MQNRIKLNEAAFINFLNQRERVDVVDIYNKFFYEKGEMNALLDSLLDKGVIVKITNLVTYYKIKT